MTINLEKLNNYKQEITFLINRKGKIFYHKIDLFHDHEDLLIENKDEVGEFDVCRLVYDPNNEDASFCGIPSIFASCDQKYYNLPFELKSIHLNAIENFVKEYDNIVKYAEEHKTEYELNKLRGKLRRIIEYCKTENFTTYTGDMFYYTHAKNILKIIEVDK